MTNNKIYNVVIYTDMGHMEIKSVPELPKHLESFVIDKFNMYTWAATDTKGLGCRFYMLKKGLKKNWTYFYDNNIINIKYDLSEFDESYMKYTYVYI